MRGYLIAESWKREKSTEADIGEGTVFTLSLESFCLVTIKFPDTDIFDYMVGGSDGIIFAKVRLFFFLFLFGSNLAECSELFPGSARGSCLVGL